MTANIKLKHSGGNSVIIAAPASNPAADRTLTLPSDADATIVTTTGSTFTGPVTFQDAINENVFTITDGASVDLDPDNGMIQQWTLGANRTATESLSAGQSMMLMVADGTSYTLTFPTMTWVGGSAPTLATSGFTVIELWKAGSTLYGAKVGDVA